MSPSSNADAPRSDASRAGPQVEVRVDGHVATLTLDPPKAGYDLGFCLALRDAALALADQTDEVYVVVVTFAGADVGAGWSPAVLASEGSGATALDELARLASGFEALAALPQPAVVALRGRAYSAGLELALACDIRVAAEGTTFAMPETGLGLVPRGGGTQRLPRIVGRAHALRLLLTGEEIDAAEGRRIGLASRVVPLGEEVDGARFIAEAIAARGPIATRFAKEAIQRGIELTLEQGLRAELDLTVLLQTTADRDEGVRAFVERRDPRFRGE